MLVKPVKSLGRWNDAALSDKEQIQGLDQAQHSLNGANQQQLAGENWLKRRFRDKKRLLDVHDLSLKARGWLYNL